MYVVTVRFVSHILYYGVSSVVERFVKEFVPLRNSVELIPLISTLDSTTTSRSLITSKIFDALLVKTSSLMH